MIIAALGERSGNLLTDEEHNTDVNVGAWELILTVKNREMIL